MQIKLNYVNFDYETKKQLNFLKNYKLINKIC